MRRPQGVSGDRQRSEVAKGSRPAQHALCACHRLKIRAERRMRSSLTRRIMRMACSAPEREEEEEDAASEGSGAAPSSELISFSTTATTTSTGTAVTTSSGIQEEA